MSRQRSKGTSWETELLQPLRSIFGDKIDRAPLRGIHDDGDFVNVPLPIEAKNQITPRFLEWARCIRPKALRHGLPTHWAILWHGDRRTPEGKGLMTVDLEFGLDLLMAFYGPFGRQVEE